MLRAEYGPQVDPREAFVDSVLINAYGGPGVTNAWIDDLEVAGVVVANVTAADESAASAVPGTEPERLPSLWPGGHGVPRVELKDSLLLVDGKPFFPRIIEHRGEPLERLQALGFNVVRVPQTPAPEFLQEAARLGMWLVAPPPSAQQLDGGKSAPAKLGEVFDPVLVWDLGSAPGDA